MISACYAECRVEYISLVVTILFLITVIALARRPWLTFSLIPNGVSISCGSLFAGYVCMQSRAATNAESCGPSVGSCTARESIRKST